MRFWSLVEGLAPVRNSALAHIIRRTDGTSIGLWGPYTLKSAFQPIFAFENERLRPAAFEGLMRAFHNDRPIAPKTFFSGRKEEDRSDVETLARTLHLLNAGRFLDNSALIFVNFDPSLVCDPTLAAKALRDMRLVLHEAGIEPRRIVCEVTEQKSPSETALVEFAKALRSNGLRVAVDDFGEAESDAGRVERIAPDIVKFDARWVAHLMASGPGYDALVKMVENFTARGIVTIFEGIERRWQLELAGRSGVSMVQGFVLARPRLAPNDFSDLQERDRIGPVPAVAGGR
jgi:EAL domain-containing protein (putative c-di-GMP-specific phosphodiesterase class I)